MVIKWAERYNVYTADCGILHLVCAWGKGGYAVRVNDRRLEDPYPDIGSAKAARR
jgi:hypothetical protein